jgi:Zn-dependent M28 family amino/carboxypeptidase
MIASPNFVYEIYDGDGSTFNTSGPPGSTEVEKLWEDYYKNDVGIPTKPSEFDGRSDYGPFLEAGIAAGGLTSGADGVKTDAEVAAYGGTAGQIYDPNYHTATNIQEERWKVAELNATKFRMATRSNANMREDNTLDLQDRINLALDVSFLKII